jgi:hypothetical protein
MKLVMDRKPLRVSLFQYDALFEGAFAMHKTLIVALGMVMATNPPS